MAIAQLIFVPNSSPLDTDAEAAVSTVFLCLFFIIIIYLIPPFSKLIILLLYISSEPPQGFSEVGHFFSSGVTESRPPRLQAGDLNIL